MLGDDDMIVSAESKILCENRNAELVLEEIFRISPDIRFVIFDDEFTERSAIMLYNAVANIKSKEYREFLCVPCYDSVETKK